MDIFFFTVLERDVGRRNFNRDFGWGGKLIKKKEKGLAKKKTRFVCKDDFISNTLQWGYHSCSWL